MKANNEPASLQHQHSAKSRCKAGTYLNHTNGCEKWKMVVTIKSLLDCWGGGSRFAVPKIRWVL